MAAQSGQAVVLSIKNNAGTPVFVPVGGMRTRKLAFNAETVDITHAASAGRWREFLDLAGIQSATISGDGVFVDDATDAEIDEAFLAGSIRDWKILLPSFAEYVGPFKITQLERGADYNKECTFSMTLESAGAIAMTAV
jgi:TP901-1 family phage major tail protein